MADDQIPASPTPAGDPLPATPASVQPLDFSAVPGHQQHGPAPQPNVHVDPAAQYVKNLETQQSGEKEYSDFLYKNSPDEYRKADPVGYFARKIHGVISEAAARGIEHDPEYLKNAVAPHVQALADFASGQLGVTPGSLGHTAGLAASPLMPEGGFNMEDAASVQRVPEGAETPANLKSANPKLKNALPARPDSEQERFNTAFPTARDTDLKVAALSEPTHKAFLDVDGSLVGHGLEHEETLQRLGVVTGDEHPDYIQKKVDDTVKKGAIRLAGYGMPDSPLYIQISKAPTDAQREFIGKAIRDQGGVVYDLAPKGLLGNQKKTVGGEGVTPGDFWRKVDTVFPRQQTTTPPLARSRAARRVAGRLGGTAASPEVGQKINFDSIPGHQVEAPPQPSAPPEHAAYEIQRLEGVLRNPGISPAEKTIATRQLQDYREMFGVPATEGSLGSISRPTAKPAAETPAWQTQAKDTEIQRLEKVQRSPEATPEERRVSGDQLRDYRGENADPKSIVESAGGVFRHSKNGLTEITLPASMTDKLNLSPAMKNWVSVTIPDGEVTPENVKARMEQKFKEFGGKTEEKPKGTTFLSDVANTYSQGQGLEPLKPEPVEPDPRQDEIADAYKNATHAPEDPRVKKSYDALKRDVDRQYDLAKSLGIRMDVKDENPYGLSTTVPAHEELHNDILNNRHLSIWSGGAPPEGHPLAEVDPKTGFTYNEKFRMVHDIFGHAKEKADFSPAGEESAWNQHRQMFSPEARPALATETRGQAAYTYKYGDFPPQKAAILPERYQVRPEDISPEVGQTPEPESPNADIPESQRTATPETGYHPTLQTIADKHGVTEDPYAVRNGASFITPDGKYIHLGSTSHDDAILASQPKSQETLGKDVPQDETGKSFSPVLRDGQSIADYIEEHAPYEVDRGLLDDRYRNTHAILRKVPLDSLEQGSGAGNIRSRKNETKYAKMPLSTMPPLLVEDGKIMDGNHRARVLQQKGEKNAWIYDVKDGKPEGAGDPRIPFLNDSGAIRTRVSFDRAGHTIHISVPKDGVTPEQVQALKEATQKSVGKNGNVVMERADLTAETKDQLSKTKEFGNANDIEPMLHQIQAHPDDKWYAQAGKRAEKEPAGGIDPRTGKSDTEGHGTEIFPEKRMALDHAPTKEDFQNFYDQNKELFDQHPELKIGWDNDSKVPGGHEINIGAVGKGAKRVAKKLEQRAAFDIGKGEEIPTGGEGLRTEFPNYPLAERIKDLNGEPQSDIKGFESLSPEFHANLEPDERAYLKDNNLLQSNAMSQYHKIQPSVNETTNAMQAGAALGGWWQRYIDVFHGLADGGEQAAKQIGPSHAEVLKQWHAAVSGNKSVEDANNLAWHSYADWLDAGKPTDRKSIDDIVRKNGAQPFGSEKRGNAAISDTRTKKGKLVTPGLDTTKLFNLVNSPEMKGERPFSGDVFYPEVGQKSASGDIKAYHGTDLDSLVDILKTGKIDKGFSTQEEGDFEDDEEGDRFQEKYGKGNPSHAVFAYPGKDDISFTHEAMLEFKGKPFMRREIAGVGNQELLFSKSIPRKDISRIIIGKNESRFAKPEDLQRVRELAAKHGIPVQEVPYVRDGVPSSSSEEEQKNPLMGTKEGARKLASMGATVAGKGNLNRLVIDAHIRDFYGHKQAGGPAAQYIADSVHLRQAAKALGLKGGEGQEQLWGTVLGLKTLLKEGLTPEEASGKLNADVINQIGKDYAEVIANDPEIPGVLDRLKKLGVGRGSAGLSETNLPARSAGASEGPSGGSEAGIDKTQLEKTAGRIREQISPSKIKKPASSTQKASEGGWLKMMTAPVTKAKYKP